MEPGYTCVTVLVFIYCLPARAGGIRLGCKPSRKANVLHGGKPTLITCGWLDRMFVLKHAKYVDR